MGENVKDFYRIRGQTTLRCALESRSVNVTGIDVLLRIMSQEDEACA